MGFDLSVKFENPACYTANAKRFARMAKELPSTLDSSPNREEIWLKSEGSSDPWGYDARILFKENSLEIEVMGFGSSFHTDIRDFVAQISKECPAVLVDDDGEPF